MCEVAARCLADGQLTCSSADLDSKFGFHDGDLLLPFWDALCASAIDPALVPGHDALLSHLVHATVLVPLAAAGTVVTVGWWSGHNPARVDLVNGLTENGAAIPYLRTVVAVDDLVRAFLAAQDQSPPPVLEVPSTVAADLGDLVGRRVWVTTDEARGADAFDESIGGLLLTAGPDALVVATHPELADELTVIPLARVLRVTTSQVTAAERRRLDPEAYGDQ